MRIEHVGIQHPDPVGAGEWYVRHLGFRIARSGGAPAHARYLFDDAGRTMIEIYNNPQVPMPDYAAMHPVVLHLAVATDDVRGLCERLVAAGATPAGDFSKTDMGDEFVMVRDPWGVPIQLMNRRTPFA